jgi:hypothetical protein
MPGSSGAPNPGSRGRGVGERAIGREPVKTQGRDRPADSSLDNHPVSAHRAWAAREVRIHVTKFYC